MISIIIVHWNTPDDLRKQLQGLAPTVIARSEDFTTKSRLHRGSPTKSGQSREEIIVVDNNSTEPLDWITQNFPPVTLIKNTLNRGFAFACNQGAAVATGDWLLFLNPDVDISSDQIHNLIEEAKKHGLDACSPEPASDNYRKPIPTIRTLLTEFTPLGKIIGSPTYLSAGAPILSGAKAGEGGAPRRGEVVNNTTLTGGCLLIKSSVLHALGGWDERFFIWFEDSDLSARLVEENYKIGFVPVTIHHAGGTSFRSLHEKYKKHLFFHAMDVYARKHFSETGIFIAENIKRQYSQRTILPTHHKGVSITVPNLKKELLQTFLDTNKIYLDSIEELVIVTSALKPAEFYAWKRAYPQIRWILIKDNKGFAPTVNIGFRASTGEWIGTVNDDVRMTDGWIQSCLNADGSHVGSLNPVIYKDDETIESAGITILKKGKAIPITAIPARYKLPATSYTTDASNAAAVLYKSSALNAIGLFDERFGSYLEDIDLSLRMKRSGLQNRVATTAKVYHTGHSTSATHLNTKKSYYDFRNWLYIILKNWSVDDAVLHASPLFLERLRNISGLIKAYWH